MSDPAKGEANRLARETSPYLRLHAYNPVDWYPWGAEALTRAREEDRPIFLSVGYSTCYWCHVMERESFSDAAIASRMNRGFVNIKLDREERPDLDEIYMAATQVLSGQGGWPNSLFLTPDLKPFFAGTYFPPDDRSGRPGFPRVLESMEQAWTQRRGDVEEQAASVARALEHYLEERVEPGVRPPSGGAVHRSLADLADRFDEEWGGFGSAPKFPTPSNLYLLQELAGESEEAAGMLRATLDQMARGGIYDQLGGGFHRYATDTEWRIPHFEKMLYDNALLLDLYSAEAVRTGDSQAERVAREVFAYLGREMTSPEGALWSAQDAETDGDEGAFFVWTREELRALLGEEDFGFLAPVYGFEGAPFFEGDRYVLHLPKRLEERARERRLEGEAFLAELEPLRRRLFDARGRRERPLVDDKVLADWNGMAIFGLARAGARLNDRRMIRAAERAASFVLTELRSSDGGLLHVWREGEAKIPAFLADYAHLLRGSMALYEATGDSAWLSAAAGLAEEQVDRLGDPRGGFYTAAASGDVLFRSKEVFDGATPGANAVAVLGLLELAERSGDARWLAQAEGALRYFANLVERHPEAVRSMALAARRYEALTAGAAPSGEHSRPRAETASQTPEVVSLELEAAAPDSGGVREVALTAHIAGGWHLDGVRLAGRDVEILEATLPQGVERELAAGQPPVHVLEGEVRFEARVRSTGEQPRLILHYQPCDDRRCLAPTTALIDLE
jgi:hypothetical protein